MNNSHRVIEVEVVWRLWTNYRGQ